MSDDLLARAMKSTIIREKVFKTGMQTLWRSGARFYMSIRNRSYTATYEVPLDRVPLWMDYFDRP